MAETVTSALELQEAGVLLRAEGSHTVRVLGTAPRLLIPPETPMKEDLRPPAPESVYARYYAGELAAPPPDPAAPPDEPQVPALFITAAGEPVFLGRNRA